MKPHTESPTVNAKPGIILTIIAVVLSNCAIPFSALGLLPIFEGRDSLEMQSFSVLLAVLHIVTYLVMVVSIAAVAVDINGLWRDRTRWLLWIVLIVFAVWSVLNSAIALKLGGLLMRSFLA